TKVARFATFAADYGPATDIDMFVYQAGTSTLVGQSAGGDAQEAVTVTAPGSYDVYVVQFALDPGVTEQDVKLNGFAVGPVAAGAPLRLALSFAHGVWVSPRSVETSP